MSVFTDTTNDENGIGLFILGDWMTVGGGGGYFQKSPGRMADAERRTGNHKGCPYEWFAGRLFSEE